MSFLKEYVKENLVFARLYSFVGSCSSCLWKAAQGLFSKKSTTFPAFGLVIPEFIRTFAVESSKVYIYGK